MPLPYSTPYASPQPMPPSPLYTQVLSDLHAAPHSPIPPYPAQAYHNYQPPQPIWPSQRQPSEGLYNSSTDSNIATSSPTTHPSQPPTLSNTSMVHFPVTADRARSPYAARPLPRFGVSTMPWHPDPPEASLHPRQLPPNSFASHSIAAAAAGYVRDVSHPPHPTDISPPLIPANGDHVATNSSPYSVPTTIHFDAAHYDSSGYRHAPAMSSSDAAIASSSPLASPILADGLHPHRQEPTAPSMSAHIDTAGHGTHNGLSVNPNAHPLAVEWNRHGHSHGNTARAVVYGGSGGDDVTTDPDVGADADADAEGEDDCDIDVDLDATVLPSKPISNGAPSGYPADSSMVYLDATHTHFDDERREYIEYHENQSQSQSQSHAYVVSPASAPGSESVLRLRAPAAPNVRYTPYPAYAGPPPPPSSHVHPDVYNTLADQQHHHHRYHNHDIDIPVHPHRQLQQQQYHYDYSDTDEVDAQGIRTRKVSSTSTAGSSSSHSSASTSTSATSILPLTPTSPFSSPIGVNYLPGVGGPGCYGGNGNSVSHSHTHGVGVLPTPPVSISHNRISNQTFNSTANPPVNVNTNGSSSGPVELKRRTRQSTPLPVPIPIPNLTKKSRGRRVPTLSNWDHLHQQQQRGQLGGSERDDEYLDGNLAGDAVGGGSARRGSMSAGASAGSGGGERSSGGRGKAGGARMFTCVVDGCGKCFARGEHLKRHVRSIHTYDKPHKCPYPGCGKDFSRHDNLGQHMRVHKDYVPPPKNAGPSSAGFSGYREVHHP